MRLEWGFGPSRTIYVFQMLLLDCNYLSQLCSTTIYLAALTNIHHPINKATDVSSVAQPFHHMQTLLHDHLYLIFHRHHAALIRLYIKLL